MPCLFAVKFRSLALFFCALNLKCKYISSNYNKNEIIFSPLSRQSHIIHIFTESQCCFLPSLVIFYLLCASFTIYWLPLLYSIFLDFTFNAIVWVVTLSYWIFSALHIRTHIALICLYTFCTLYSYYCLWLAILTVYKQWKKKKWRKTNYKYTHSRLSGLSGVWEYPSHQYEYNDVVVDISYVL